MLQRVSIGRFPSFPWKAMSNWADYNYSADSGISFRSLALSDKLDASNGVIRPTEGDPAIEKKPPPTGAAAVIPPPGSPGGPQGMQPK